MFCCLGIHNWTWPWKIVYDHNQCITGYYYKECTNPGCRKVKIKFNFDKVPEHK